MKHKQQNEHFQVVYLQINYFNVMCSAISFILLYRQQNATSLKQLLSPKQKQDQCSMVSRLLQLLQAMRDWIFQLAISNGVATPLQINYI